MKNKKAWFLIVFLLLVVIVNYCCLHLTEWLSFENISRQRDILKTYVRDYPLLAPLAYILLYTISTAFSVPGGAFNSLVGGFLFPQPYSTIYVVIGATLGATLLFIAARTLFRSFLKEKAEPYLGRFRAGFQENEASYLLFLRLVPLFPFWLVNLAPAFLGVRLSTFIWTTAVGIIPGVFVFTQAGAGLDSILQAEHISIDSVFNRDIKIALIALAIFALIPVVVKKLRKK